MKANALFGLFLAVLMAAMGAYIAHTTRNEARAECFQTLSEALKAVAS